MSWARTFRLRQYVRQSLWVLPLVGAVMGALLADVDARAEADLSLPESWQYSPGTASGALTAIVGATVGLIGFVVTISVLVVQTATGTLSPRFMRLWYRDRLQKLVLAMFTATFTFSFSLLRRVESDFVPNLGVTVAGAAVGISLILLLVYLDRFVHTLRPVAVAAMVSRAGQAVVAEALRQVRADGAAGAATVPAQARSTPDLAIAVDRAGAIQAINRRGVVSYAERHDSLVVLRRSVGDFIQRGTVVMEVHGAGGGAAGERRLRTMVALGRERTVEQDAAFALRILVDIAIRALSPAVNDPTTATQVVDHIGDLLRTIGQTDFRGVGCLRDARGRVRVIVPTRTWEAYLELGVTEIRHYGSTSPQTCRRLRAMLTGLLNAVRPEHRDAIVREIALLDALIDAAFPRPSDRDFARVSDRQGIGGVTHPWP